MDFAGIIEFITVMFADFDINELINVILGLLGGLGA